jgi:hypothetical protein
MAGEEKNTPRIRGGDELRRLVTCLMRRERRKTALLFVDTRCREAVDDVGQWAATNFPGHGLWWCLTHVADLRVVAALDLDLPGGTGPPAAGTGPPAAGTDVERRVVSARGLRIPACAAGRVTVIEDVCLTDARPADYMHELDDRHGWLRKWVTLRTARTRTRPSRC